MTILELKDKINTLAEQRQAVIDNAASERRDLSEVEKRENDDALEQIKKWKSELTIAELRLAKVELEKKTVENKEEVRQFTLLKAVAEAAEPEQHLSEETRALDRLGREEMRKAGLDSGAMKGIVLPVIQTRATITATAGASVIATEIQPLMPALRDALVLNAAGAHFMAGLRGNLSFPSYSGSTANWVGTGVSATDGAGTFSTFSMAPKRLAAIITVDKQFLLQESADAEAMLRRDIVDAIAGKLEASILGAAAGTTSQPAGLLNGITLTAAVPTKKSVNALKVAVKKANIAAMKPAYFTNSEGVGILEVTPWSTSSDRYLCENGKVGGIPVYETNAIAAGGTGSDEHPLIFADASQIIIGQWGAIELRVDPYTLADKDQVRIIVNSYWDFKVRRTAALAATAIK